MRKPKDKDFWEEELKYIKSVNPLYPGEMYNYSPTVFRDYVEMQSKFCKNDAFDDISEEMNQHIFDIDG